MGIESQEIEATTTAIQVPETSVQPDSKTRRYDRQLRLWAAAGQNALESAHILVVSASATSTAVLKNLVLPGIGRFTILDPGNVSEADAGNNFFFEGAESIGKKRAEEAVRLLLEMNEGVQGTADVRDIESCLSDPKYLSQFKLIIVHNLSSPLQQSLAKLLWTDPSLPPLITVRSAGFLAEFHIQLREHTIVVSHSEATPSLRIDKPFPALLEHARSLDFDNMNSTDHGHIPYVVILVRALDDWKKAHGGKVPKTNPERDAFKSAVAAMKHKPDEDNFDEAISQSYRAYAETKVPFDIAELFSDPGLTNLSSSSSPFFHLLAALKEFSEKSQMKTLPLSATLPDMKSDTASYVHLQKLYKAEAEKEKQEFVTILKERCVDAQPDMVDEFVRHAHELKIVRGRSWESFDSDPKALADAISSSDKIASVHLALSALSHLLAENPAGQGPTEAQITARVKSLLLEGTEITESVAQAIGEVARTPTADLPNTAAFLGGLIAQEAIKVVTAQYVPVNGVCVVDLIESSTGIME